MNLSLSEDRYKRIHDWVIDRLQYDDQQRAHRKEGRRLDKHGGDGLVQSTDSSWGSRGSADIPAMQGEPDNNHGGEEDVE